MIDRIKVPKDIHILIPRMGDYVTLSGKRDFAYVIKLIILIGEDYAGFSRWVQYHHKSPEKKQSQSRRCDENRSQTEREREKKREGGRETKILR